MFLFSNMVCFVLIIVFWVQVCWFLTWQWLFLNQKNQTRACFCFRTRFVLFWLLCFDFCFSVQVCWFLTSRCLFLNSKNIRQEHVFVFGHVFFVLTIVFWVQVCWFITWKWLFLNKKYQTRACFCFRTWVLWLLCFDFCFSVQVCLFLISRWLLLNEKTCQEKCMFCLWICFVWLFITF